MSATKSVAANMRAKCLPSGRSVGAWGKQQTEQNYAYRALEDLFERISGQAFNNCYKWDDGREQEIERIVGFLRTFMDEPTIYLSHVPRPGMFGFDGDQLFIEPKHSYGLLVSFAEEEDDGLPGLLQAFGLSQDTPRKLIIGSAALLDMDVALDQIEKGEGWRATWTIYCLADAAQEIDEIKMDDFLKEQRRENAAKAGKAAHKETNEYKKEVLKAWTENRFKSIAACARWACRQFPIDADETPKRWIRAYEKSLLG